MKIRIKRLLQIFLVISFIWLGIFAQSESSIPANFTTYTDETSLFSISYPVNWEPAFSLIENFKQEAENVLKSIDEKGTFKKNNVVFFGGIPLDNGYYNPNMSIVVEPLGDDNVKLEDFVCRSVSDVKRLVEEYHELSRTKTIIDGRQAIILDYEYRFPNWPLIHSLTMFTVIDKFAWVIGCGILPPLNFNDFKDDIYAIVKSFKILSNPPKSEGIFDKMGEAAIRGLGTGLVLSILLAAYLILKKIISFIVKKDKKGKF